MTPSLRRSASVSGKVLDRGVGHLSFRETRGNRVGVDHGDV
jgi:enamine deaminase RidA (YjgF/YER057c/UK114 family)